MKKITIIILITVILMNLSACLGYEVNTGEESVIKVNITSTIANKNNKSDEPIEKTVKNEKTEIIETTNRYRDEHLFGIADEEQNIETSFIKKELTLGDTFKFDGLEITFGTDVRIVIHESNSIFDMNKTKEVVRVPIAVKNIKEESNALKRWDLTFFGPQGIEIEDMSRHFSDNIKNDNIRSSVEIYYSLYFLYEGNGDYFIEFNDYGRKTEVKVPVTKEVT